MEEELATAQESLQRGLLQFNEVLVAELSRAKEQNAWIREATRKLTCLQQKLQLEEGARCKAELREKALRQEVASLKRLLRQERGDRTRPNLVAKECFPCDTRARAVQHHDLMHSTLQCNIARIPASLNHWVTPTAQQTEVPDQPAQVLDYVQPAGLLQQWESRQRLQNEHLNEPLIQGLHHNRPPYSWD